MDADYERRLIELQNKVVRGFNTLFEWQAELSEKLDKLIELASATMPKAEDPKEEARRWFRCHFLQDFPGDPDRYLNLMSSYEYPRSREDAGEYIADMCGIGLLSEEDACTTECARHAMALMKISGKCSPDYLRRAISAAVHAPDEEPDVEPGEEDPLEWDGENWVVKTT